MSDISWTNTTVKLGALKPWERNPKTTTKKEAQLLLKSWKQLGQFQNIAVGPDAEVYDGHQRLSALLTVYGKEYEIAARQSSRALTDEERKAVTLASRQIGAWDWDELSAWNASELGEWGFDGELLNNWQRDVSALGTMLGVEEDDTVPDVGKDESASLSDQYMILIECDSEHSKAMALEALEEQGYICRALVS
jgi:hypothetical protein